MYEPVLDYSVGTNSRRNRCATNNLAITARVSRRRLAPGRTRWSACWSGGLRRLRVGSWPPREEVRRQAWPMLAVHTANGLGIALGSLVPGDGDLRLDQSLHHAHPSSHHVSCKKNDVPLWLAFNPPQDQSSMSPMRLSSSMAPHPAPAVRAVSAFSVNQGNGSPHVPEHGRLRGGGASARLQRGSPPATTCWWRIYGGGNCAVISILANGLLLSATDVQVDVNMLNRRSLRGWDCDRGERAPRQFPQKPGTTVVLARPHDSRPIPLETSPSPSYPGF